MIYVTCTHITYYTCIPSWPLAQVCIVHNICADVHVCLCIIHVHAVPYICVYVIIQLGIL